MSEQAGLRYVPIRGIIRCESGVRVGGTRDELEIGGLDNPVVREAGTREPYLPGSSLKGRMRGLVEREGNYELGGERRNEPHGARCGRCLLCRVFGPHFNDRHSLGPSRIIVRDAYLTNGSRAIFEKDPRQILEVRTENIIDRASNTAKHPRPVESVVRGTMFELKIDVRILAGDDESDILGMVRRGLDLLEKDGIGGGIGRGHGQISISFREPKDWAST